MNEMNNKKYTGLSKKRVVIPAYSTTKVDYNDTKPNYYRVQNSGKSPIYCGTSHMPTANNYDFMCNAEGMKMYAEPYNRTTLYIFNPSGNEIAVTVLSFSAEFDPLTLALSEISLDLPTAELGISTSISSFETPLPAGTNTIGKVDFGETEGVSILRTSLRAIYDTLVILMSSGESSTKTNLYEIQQTMLELKSAIENKDFSADISGDINATIDNSDVIEAINNKEITVDNSDVVEAINGLKLESDNSDIVSAVNKSVKPKQITSKGESKTVTGYGSITVEAGSGKKITSIDFLSNDGENEISLEFGDVVLPIKAGEVLNNVRLYLDSFMIAENAGKTSAVRYLVTIEEV